MSETTQDVVDDSGAEEDVALEPTPQPDPSAEGDGLVLSITDAGLTKGLEIRDG